MKNILLILDRYYPTDHAFIERVYSDLIHEHHYQVYFVMRSRFNSKFCEVKKWNRSIVITFKLPGWDKMVTRWWLNLRILFTCIRISSRIKPDILQVRNWIFGSYIALVIKRLRKILFVYQYSFPFHLIADENLKTGNLIKKIRTLPLTDWQNKIFYQSDVIFAITPYMKDQLINLGVNGKKIYPVGLGFDTHMVNTNVPGYQADCPKDKNYILYFGMMDKNRKMEFLLDAWKAVLRKHHDAKLYMVGGIPADIHRLQIYAKLQGIDSSVVFTGWITRSLIQMYINHSMFTVSPIPPIPLYNVSSPTKLFESLGYGKPVITSNTPEQEWVINISGGGISTGYTIEKFTEAIIYLLDNRDLVQLMGIKGKRFVLENKTYEHITSRIDQIYSEC